MVRSLARLWGCVCVLYHMWVVSYVLQLFEKSSKKILGPGLIFCSIAKPIEFWFQKRVRLLRKVISLKKLSWSKKHWKQQHFAFSIICKWCRMCWEMVENLHQNRMSSMLEFVFFSIVKSNQSWANISISALAKIKIVKKGVLLQNTSGTQSFCILYHMSVILHVSENGRKYSSKFIIFHNEIKWIF